MSEPNWSLDDCIRRHDEAHQLREMRDDQERRYREDQQRESYRNTQARQAGVETSSVISDEDREWYYEKGKAEIERINRSQYAVPSRSYSREELNVMIYALFALIIVGAFILGALSN